MQAQPQNEVASKHVMHMYVQFFDSSPGGVIWHGCVDQYRWAKTDSAKYPRRDTKCKAAQSCMRWVRDRRQETGFHRHTHEAKAAGCWADGKGY